MEKTLYFCTRCGACCRWPGYVRVSENEIRAMAASLGISADGFIARFTRLTDDRMGLSLTEQADGSCIFLRDGNGCRVHGVKPGQCRAFPNTWNFPGFREQCACRSLTVHIRECTSSPATGEGATA